LEHFLSRAGWVNPERTVDRVIVGDEEEDVSRCLVTWMPSYSALRRAAEGGYRLLICHEPVFWHHWDNEPAKRRAGVEKLRFIEAKGLTILRIHDSWDRWPGVGIPWAWARFLGLGEGPAKMGASGYQHRYDIEPRPFQNLARGFARRCAKLGEPRVQVVGDGRKTVSRIGVGTGCACDLDVFVGMGCDCSVVCDDGSSYWAGIQMAEDLGHPVIRVNHGTSEEPGMVTLARYINEEVGLEAEHLPHGCTFRLVGGRRSS